ncbi:MAG TPA: UDP-2,3-diacylglucosamine diphosphatase [Gemmatimonadaceae bacterium]|nr:UDP-2,3-diacylglucosamine diphosphatase [Gemmatimonadaceae bacterium]
MLPGPCYIISDAHLGAGTADLERRVVAFLHSLRGRAGSVVVNGDLFDFWFEWRTVVPRRGIRAAVALADLRDAGVDVLWIAGNHDCWGGEVLREDFGLAYHVGPWEGRIAGWKTRIEHGDGLRDEEDRKYRRLRTLLRHPWSVRAFRALHPDLGSRLASGSSHASRVHRARDGGAGLRGVAMEALARDETLDLVVFGHSHVPALERAPSGGIYANAGSWLDAPTFIRVAAERVELCRWDGSAEGVRLDAVDRRAEKSLGHP